MEWQLFEPGTVPVYTTASWYANRARAPHLEQEGHGARLYAAFELVEQAISRLSIRTSPCVVDIGCGDGGLLSLIKDRYPNVRAWGYDLSPSNIEAAVNVRGVVAEVFDVIEDSFFAVWGEIAIVTEFLEHLVDPHAFVRTIADHSPVVIASSPAYEDNNAYEFHTYAWDLIGYQNLFTEVGFRVLEHKIVSGSQLVLGVHQKFMPSWNRCRGNWR